MLKKTIYLTIALALLLVFGALLWIAPYHIYTLSLTEGVNTTFLVMKPARDVLYNGHEININHPAEMTDEALYQTFHFAHFEMPMPFNHPGFSMIPTIKLEGAGPRLGASFMNGKDYELFSFMLERTYKLNTTLGDQKLFILPVFKNYMARKNQEDVWRDLYEKKLSLPSNQGESFWASLDKLKKVSYYDLVYNLFILYNRHFLIPQEVLHIGFLKGQNMGLVELPSDDHRYKKERLYLMENGIVYPLTIRTRLFNKTALNFRAKLLSEIKIKSNSTDAAIPIYAQYKRLPYGQRVDQQGMTYLYSAWSHDLNNKDFIRVIILFLERGKLNLKFLKPFYEYAYKKFGSTLSSDSELLSETAEEKLKRKMDDELSAEVSIEKDKITPTFEGQFSSDEEKVKYFLQKAKDQKFNSDEKEKVLSIE